MIQRIQTVYLFVITVLSIVTLCLPVGRFVDGQGTVVAEMYNLWLLLSDGTKSYAPWALFVMLLLVALVAFGAIFLYKKRMRQVRLTIFSGLLLVGYYIAYGIFAYILGDKYEASFNLSWVAGLPAVALILDYLAFRGIMKDEMIVRSLDRLR